jgi:hypothetical protein
VVTQDGTCKGSGGWWDKKGRDIRSAKQQIKSTKDTKWEAGCNQTDEGVKSSRAVEKGGKRAAGFTSGFARALAAGASTAEVCFGASAVPASRQGRSGRRYGKVEIVRPFWSLDRVIAASSQRSKRSNCWSAGRRFLLARAENWRRGGVASVPEPNSVWVGGRRRISVPILRDSMLTT